MKPHALAVLALCAALGLPGAAQAAAGEKIGTVDTAFQWIGRDHDIIVEAYDDPGVQGVTCYVSRARTGGLKGTLGLAEDRARQAEQERRRTEADEAADKEAGNTGMAAPVGLAQRAWPLLNMMEESLREETPVVWGV